eukprot:3789449-Rhodomonas_salina.2
MGQQQPGMMPGHPAAPQQYGAPQAQQYPRPDRPPMQPHMQQQMQQQQMQQQMMQQQQMQPHMQQQMPGMGQQMPGMGQQMPYGQQAAHPQQYGQQYGMAAPGQARMPGQPGEGYY